MSYTDKNRENTEHTNLLKFTLKFSSPLVGIFMGDSLLKAFTNFSFHFPSLDHIFLQSIWEPLVGDSTIHFRRNFYGRSLFPYGLKFQNSEYIHIQLCSPTPNY
jgi:hypothetical protein